MFYRAVCVGVLAGLALAGCSDSPGSGDRLHALREAAIAGDDRAAEQVGASARDPDTRVAAQAIVLLGRMRSSKAADILKDVLATERRPELRKWAALSLGQRREPQAAAVLGQAVRRDPAPEVRSQAAVSLGQAGTIDDVAVLAGAAGAETDPQVIRSEVAALEMLIGVKFPYDAGAAPEAQREQLERLRATAVRLMQVKKGYLAADAGCAHPTPKPGPPPKSK